MSGQAVFYRGGNLSVDGSSLVPLPIGEALIRTTLAGICNTDIEITRGYFGFEGVLGHEFVGVVEECPGTPEWIGRRVVGEINACCRLCETCLRGDDTHCPNRTTLGIFRRDGCMAERFHLPAHLLLEVPESISDEEAVFVEPLAAACEILEQLSIRPTDRVVLFGDGKLGLLIAMVVALTGCDLTVVGKHESKLAILGKLGIRTQLKDDPLAPGADIVIEATGSAEGFAAARAAVRPRGTMVLKSTFHGDVQLNLSMLVVDEIRVIGSRCGPFAAALRLLERRLVDVRPLISTERPLGEAVSAFEEAQRPGVLKVLLRP